jgi:hypothetical protein
MGISELFADQLEDLEQKGNCQLMKH